jgi:hypothetical protein
MPHMPHSLQKRGFDTAQDAAHYAAHAAQNWQLLY